MSANIGSFQVFHVLFDDFPNQSRVWQAFVLTAFCFAFYSIITAGVWLYRLYFHPLAQFLGPRKAAISRSWLFQQKQLPFPEKVYEELHAYYGTKALRIGPNELHLTDVALYKEVYSQTNPCLKDSSFYGAFLTPHTIFAENDPTLHRERSKLLSPFFSRGGVLKLEPVVRGKIDTFLQKLRKVSQDGPVDVRYAFRCLTFDIVSQFAFGRSCDFVNKSTDDFKVPLFKTIDEGAYQITLLQHSRMLTKIFENMPLRLVAAVDQSVAQIYSLHTFGRDSVTQYKEREKEPSHPVLFENLQAIPAEAQAMEAVNVLLAGSDTTAHTLATAVAYILKDADIKTKLLEALSKATSAPRVVPSLIELEQIEYLWACVKESVRIAMPVPGILPRVVPEGRPPLVVEGRIIPPGTVVGMSAYTMHTNTDLWGSDARSFNPERWLGPDGKTLDQHLYTFSKGARQCIASSVAYGMITMVLAHLFYNFDMTLQTPKLEVLDRFGSSYASPVLVEFKPRK